MANQLFVNGYGTSEAAFGRFGDPVSNGKPPGGVHVNSQAPSTPGEAQVAIEMAGAKGALSVQGELFWLLVAVVGFGVLNYHARK